MSEHRLHWIHPSLLIWRFMLGQPDRLEMSTDSLSTSVYYEEFVSSCQFLYCNYTSTLIIDIWSLNVHYTYQCKHPKARHSYSWWQGTVNKAINKYWQQSFNPALCFSEVNHVPCQMRYFGGYQEFLHPQKLCLRWLICLKCNQSGNSPKVLATKARRRLRTANRRSASATFYFFPNLLSSPIYKV